MERELFSWTGWDGEPECMFFYEPILKVQIGDFPVGTKFNSACILQNDTSNILEFYNEGKDVATFEIHMTVGKRIN